MWNIIKKELLSNLISFRFVLIFLLCATLIIISAYTMRDKYEERLREYSASVKIHKQELEESEDLQQALSKASMSGYKLDKPPAPLSTLVEGMDGAAGKYAAVNIISTPLLEGGSGSDPMFAFFGTLDLMYIVRVVLSLVAILLTYDAISGEHEQGTLKLSLSNSIPRANILLAKCLGSYITLLMPFLVPMLIGLLILVSSKSVNFTGEEWIRLGFILILSILYIGVFLILGLMVSGRTNRSTTSLMMLLFIWVIVVLAVPKLSMIIADKAHRVPTIQQVQADKDAATAQIIKELQEKMYQLIRERAKNISDAEMRDTIAKTQEEMTTRITETTQKIQTEYEKSKADQFRLAANISRLSPASAYTYAATELARTGFNKQERFLSAARAYQPGFIKYFNEMIPKLMQQQTQKIRGEKIEQTKIDLDQLPALNFREASLSESWNSIWVDFLILFLLIVCLFMVAYVSFIRSDVH